MVAEIFRYDCSHIMLSLNDDDDDAKALPTGVPKDDAMKKGGWGGQNVSKSDGVILVCSLKSDCYYHHFLHQKAVNAVCSVNLCVNVSIIS